MSKPSLKKRDSTSSRDLSSKGQSPTKEVSSLVSGVSGSFSGELWRSCAPIWPEWNETEVSAEKWDATRGVKDSKARKSPLTQFFEDPEGKVKIPAVLNVHSWKRPSEHIVNKVPVVVENESTFDLNSANEHLLSSELLRRIISEIYIVWRERSRQAGDDNQLLEKTWRPWDHIYSLCKATKDHVPLYNVYGKYVVRLYWMGCWRKIIIDDSLPFDEQNNLLLPATTDPSELWPMLLAKAILKLAGTEVVQSSSRELEDFSIVHCLTGWIPEFVPLRPRMEHVEEIWKYLKKAIPTYEIMEESLKKRTSSVDLTSTGDSASEMLSTNNGKQTGSEPPPAPQIVICASFQPLNLQEKKTSMLGQMADASQTLRQYGLCQLFSHSVLLTRTRHCPLVADVNHPPAPRSKLLQTPKEITITDEPKKVQVQRPELYVGVASPFISSKLGPCKIYSTFFLESEEIEGRDPTSHHDNHNSSDSKVTAEDERKAESAANGQDSVPQKESTALQEKDMLQETWVHMQDFPKCFQTLLVFHKESSFLYQSQRSDFKTPNVKDRYFMSVDSLLPTEILICFSALIRWGDGSNEQKDSVPRPGHLCVEPFSWKSVQAHLPLLTINTSSCKAAILSLPPGRHVLRIHTQVQLGLHLKLYSKTEFVFGQEETVMPHLEKESLRFCEQAQSILRALGETIRSFSNPDEVPSVTRALEEAVCPPSLSEPAAREHWKVFSHAVYLMFCHVLGRELTSEELFAVQSLTKELTPHSSDIKDTDSVPEDDLVREPLSAARPGSVENQKVAKTLLEMWASVESDMEKHAVSLLRFMMTTNEHLVDSYPCGGDEWTKITFTDYTVPVHDTTSTWVLLFREVFHVPKAILLVPKIYSLFPCHLQVINNDTGAEVPEFFNSVLPFTYTPNKAGYTFVAYTEGTSVVGGTWRLRLIGSRELAQLERQGPVSNFIMKEFKDYYIPNKKNIICRHVVNVSCNDVRVTVQFQASNQDVYVKLSILDHERKVCSKTGKGHVVIPVYCLSPSGVSCSGALEKAGVSQSQDGPGGGHDEGRGASECQTAQTHHKYVLQAEVLYNSWPLDDSLSGFIQTLRDKESDEMRVFRHLIEETPGKLDQPRSASQKLTASKAAKAKEKDKTASKNVDDSKPHWTLRVVSEKVDVEQIEVKKDTERLEEIKAIKLAWEAAEPGRAAKAFRTRQQYLKNLGEDHTLDLTPFIRRTDKPERLKDAVMEEEQQRERLEKIQSFRLYRETVLERRRQEQEQTKQLINEQQELFKRIQEERAEMLRNFHQNRELIRTWKLEKQSLKKEV